MAATNNTISLSPFMGSIVSTIIIISVIYGFIWLFYVESGEGDISQFSLFSLSDSDQALTAPDSVIHSENVEDSGWFGIDIGKALWGFTINFIKLLFGIVLDFVSWLTPFSLLRVFIKMLFEQQEPMFYNVLNYFILRPAGLISFAYTLNYGLSFIKLSKD
jgi:hypothetical protein